jgi:hypothetical protein
MLSSASLSTVAHMIAMPTGLDSWRFSTYKRKTALKQTKSETSTRALTGTCKKILHLKAQGMKKCEGKCRKNIGGNVDTKKKKLIINRRFRQWIDSGEETNHALPRHHACVMVTKESLDSVVKNDDPEEFDMFGVMWVYLLSKRDEYPKDDEESMEQGDVAGMETEGQDKVSYTAVGISYLVPGVYSLLNGPGWQKFADPEGGIVTL